MSIRNGNGEGCPGCAGAPLTRREMLKQAANGFGMLALSSLMADEAYAGIVPSAMPHFPSKVKNVILCFMPGGVSHMDTFDPKPKLAELDGKLSGDGRRTWKGCPWSFKRYGQSGMPVSELLPHIATCVDDLAVIRSMVSGFPLHPRGNILFHTGRNVGGHPSLGSWITYALGQRKQEPARVCAAAHRGYSPRRPGEFFQRLPAGHPPGPARQGRGQCHRQPGGLR